MPKMIARHTITLGRGDKMQTIKPGEAFDFTDAELKDLPASAVRDPVNEAPEPSLPLTRAENEIPGAEPVKADKGDKKPKNPAGPDDL